MLPRVAPPASTRSSRRPAHLAIPTVLLAALTLGLQGCSDPTATSGSGGTALTASAVVITNGQAALRGTQLPRMLQVKVQRGGAPVPGMRVSWEPSAGSVQITSSLTNSAGLAGATWVLGSAPGPMTVEATVEGVAGPPVTFTATALPLVTLTADEASNGQTGVVGMLLTTPLRVRVLSEGNPSEAVVVSWQAPGMSFSPAQSLTDAMGFATTSATLGTEARTQGITATVPGAMDSPAVFTVTAVAGPATTIRMDAGSNQTVPANYPDFGWLGVLLLDQYDNPVAGQPVAWTVERGPLSFTTVVPVSDGNGLSFALVKPTGTPGTGVVRASLPGSPATVDFTLTAGPREALVRIDTQEYGFVSLINGTRPAVDTIPAGGAVTWIISPFDYEQHGVFPVGTPSFTGSDFSYASPLTLTFGTPGTYQYIDPYFGITGTLVIQ